VSPEPAGTANDADPVGTAYRRDMPLPREEIDRSLCAAFPGAPFRILDVDEVIPDQLVVALADLASDRPEPSLWVTAFQHYSNGWFEVLAAEGDDLVYSTPMETTIAIVSGTAPPWATRCVVSLFGQRRERQLAAPGFFLVGFFDGSPHATVTPPTAELL
jgi:hypothetical protein